MTALTVTVLGHCSWCGLLSGGQQSIEEGPLAWWVMEGCLGWFSHEVWLSMGTSAWWQDPAAGLHGAQSQVMLCHGS